KGDLWSGEMRGVVIDGVRVLLVNVDGDVRAYEDRCLHKGLPLSQGRLEGHLLTCFAHGWQYDACTGEGINPERISLRELAVSVAGDDVLVDVDQGAPAR